MDEAVKREVLRLIPYGLYAITCGDQTDANAFTASWLTQCSFKPPLLALAVKPDTKSHELMLQTGELVVNFLPDERRGLLQVLFQPVSKVGDKLAGCELLRGTLSAPVLADAVAYVEAKVVSHQTPGDHSLFIAEVVNAVKLSDEPPVVLADTPWQYGG